MDKVTERRHYLNQPVVARYIRFHPITWHKRIGMRAAIIGCRHSGDCGPGFMRVNAGSSCSKFVAFYTTSCVRKQKKIILTWIQNNYSHLSFCVKSYFTWKESHEVLRTCTTHQLSFMEEYKRLIVFSRFNEHFIWKVAPWISHENGRSGSGNGLFY